MSSLKAALKGHQKTHKERGQLSKRQHLGHLEKHKDYVVRARDYHRKEKVIKTLKRKARDKNPDEFYFKMINSKTKDGVHVDTSGKKTYTHDQMKLMKTQDLNYLNYKRVVESKKIEKLQSGLHMMEASDTHARQHTFFVDSNKEVENFDAAKHLNTIPELLGRAHNRPTVEMLHTKKLSTDNKTKIKVEKAKQHAYRELQNRIKRERKLEETRQQLVLQRHLTFGKGTVIKSRRKTESGDPVYRWKKKRKR